MIVDSFAPNLVVFLAGQVAAWWNLRTGRLFVGGVTSVLLWLLADWWLLQRYVFGGQGVAASVPLLSMQFLALFAVVAQCAAQWRRRRSATSRQRSRLFGDGLVAFMRSDHATAFTTFRRLVRNDPWDAASWLALGDVCAELGQAGRARRCYRRARGVDLGKDYRDLLLLRLAVAGKASAEAITTTTGEPAGSAATAAVSR
ncbi:MAG: hypothetical protein JNN13_00705 [Planctomycetes bacterium]|nr:hypothetical protein [Planctomycetota bacterium]